MKIPLPKAVNALSLTARSPEFNRQPRRVDGYLRSGLVVALLFVVTIPLYAASPRSSAAKGVKHYGQEEYDKALTEFMAGLEKAPNSPELKYDLGSALYRLQQFPQAAEAFNNAAAKKDPKLASDAWFNLGNSLYSAQKFDDAVKAYKNSLILNHDDKDAKHNLELALRAKKMQQQQQQQDNQNQDKKEQQKQDQQQEQKQQQKQQDDKKKEEEQQQKQAAQDSSQAKQDSTEQQMEPQNGPMSKEEALQLLQAMEQDEQDAQKQKLIRQFGEPKRTSKDW